MEQIRHIIFFCLILDKRHLGFTKTQETIALKLLNNASPKIKLQLQQGGKKTFKANIFHCNFTLVFRVCEIVDVSKIKFFYEEK